MCRLASFDLMSLPSSRQWMERLVLFLCCQHRRQPQVYLSPRGPLIAICVIRDISDVLSNQKANTCDKCTFVDIDAMVVHSRIV